MSDRYSVLKPLTIEMLEDLSVQMISFFNPLNAIQSNSDTKQENGRKSIVPLSVNEFIRHMTQLRGEDYYKYLHQIYSLVKKLVNANVLAYAGKGEGFTMGGERCYYTSLELTNLQKKHLLWLGEYLGLEYIQHRASPFVIPITGIDNNNQIGIGTGTLINENTILTCAHVLNDMTVDDFVEICGNRVEIIDIKTHPKVDVGIIKLNREINLGFQLVFGEGNVLSEILTMGYPPVPMARDAYLISQKGEINSLIQSYDGTNNFIYSSITRPGNSGGPIFSNKGHIVGISARHLERETSNSKNNVVPFFEGISTTEVIKCLYELDPKIDILYENYL